MAIFHQTSCPRNGVHPSQWQMSSEIIEASLMVALPLSTLSFSTLPSIMPCVPVNYTLSPHQEEDDDLFPSC